MLSLANREKNMANRVDLEKMLQNEDLVAKIAFDTAENEHLEV